MQVSHLKQAVEKGLMKCSVRKYFWGIDRGLKPHLDGINFLAQLTVLQQCLSLIDMANLDRKVSLSSSEKGGGGTPTGFTKLHAHLILVLSRCMPDFLWKLLFHCCNLPYLIPQ